MAATPDTALHVRKTAREARGRRLEILWFLRRPAGRRGLVRSCADPDALCSRRGRSRGRRERQAKDEDRRLDHVITIPLPWLDATANAPNF